VSRGYGAAGGGMRARARRLAYRRKVEPAAACVCEGARSGDAPGYTGAFYRELLAR